MRILHLSKFYPPVFGGIETVAFDLTEGMNRIGLRADVLCANTAFKTDRSNAPMGYSIIRAGSFGVAASTSISPQLVTEMLRLRNDYDVIHVQMPNPTANLALWASRTKARIVLHWQSDVVNQQRLLRFYEPLQSWLLKRADAIVATTENYASASPYLIKYREKTKIVPIGISDPSHQFDEKLVEKIKERFGNRKIIFSLGRMIYYKGFEVLIRGATKIPDDSVVVIGGQGPLLEKHRNLVRALDLSHKVFFIGRIPAAELASYHKAASIFCLPSTARSEAYGVVLLEAMAFGKPIVATNIAGSGVSWVNRAGQTGLNVPPFDSIALAAALTEILQDSDLSSNFARGSRTRFEDMFGSEKMVESMVEIYRNL